MEGESASAFQVSDDALGGLPVVPAITVQELRELLHSKRDVQAQADHDIVHTPDKSTVGPSARGVLLLVSFWRVVEMGEVAVGLHRRENGVSVREANLGDNAVDEGCLGDHGHARSAVTGNGNADAELRFTKIGDVPFAAQVGFEQSAGGGRAGNGEEVVDVHAGDDGALSGSPVVQAVFAWNVRETDSNEVVMHGLVPGGATLQHAVQAFAQLPDPVRLAGTTHNWPGFQS